MLRIIRHTLRFPLLSGISLLLAVACTSLMLVLPAITMRFIDVIIQGQDQAIAFLVTWGLLFEPISKINPLSASHLLRV